jgi:hypothetical protein
MVDKNLIKIINEQLNEFDFLGNGQYLKEQEVIDLLGNEEFQKQFICDSLLERNNKIKIDVTDARLGGDWQNEPEDVSKLTLEYFMKVEYKYDQTKEPVKFDLSFYSDYITVSTDDNYDAGRSGGTTDSDVAPSGSAWFNRFNWGDINVELNTTEGDEIEFLAYMHAPPKIQVLFIRNYLEEYIKKYTNMGIDTPEMNDTPQSVPYC